MRDLTGIETAELTTEMTVGTWSANARSRAAERGLTLAEDDCDTIVWRKVVRTAEGKRYTMTPSRVIAEVRRRSGLTIEELDALLGWKRAETGRYWVGGCLAPRAYADGIRSARLETVTTLTGWEGMERRGELTRMLRDGILDRVLGGTWERDTAVGTMLVLRRVA